MPSFLQIKENCLYVSDLDKTEHFYHHQLGMPVIGKVPDRHIFFRAGSSVLLCFIAEATAKDTHLPPHYASGKQHLAFETSPEEYEGWKNKLRGEGIAITHEETWPGGHKSCYFEDPDGHVLEIVPAGMWG